MIKRLGAESARVALGFTNRKNHVWSWGGRNAAGDVLLEIWDGELQLDGWWHVYDQGCVDRPGGDERLEHLAAIVGGARGVAIIGDRVNKGAQFNIDDVYRITEVRHSTMTPDVWIKLSGETEAMRLGRIASSQADLRASAASR